MDSFKPDRRLFFFQSINSGQMLTNGRKFCNKQKAIEVDKAKRPARTGHWTKEKVQMFAVSVDSNCCQLAIDKLNSTFGT